MPETVRAKGASKYIRIVDFMSQYDRMRRGTVSVSEFRRSPRGLTQDYFKTEILYKSGSV